MASTLRRLKFHYFCESSVSAATTTWKWAARCHASCIIKTIHGKHNNDPPLKFQTSQYNDSAKHFKRQINFTRPQNRETFILSRLKRKTDLVTSNKANFSIHIRKINHTLITYLCYIVFVEIIICDLFYLIRFFHVSYAYMWNIYLFSGWTVVAKVKLDLIIGVWSYLLCVCKLDFLVRIIAVEKPLFFEKGESDIQCLSIQRTFANQEPFFSSYSATQHTIILRLGEVWRLCWCTLNELGTKWIAWQILDLKV